MNLDPPIPSDQPELAKALNAFQAEVVTVAKDADNPFFRSKYADLASIMKATQPVLTKHGLSVIQLPATTMDGRPALTTILMHVSGQSERSTVPLLLAKQDSQGLGAAITYMRRYAYAAALQIVIDEDDDGNYGTTAPAKYQDSPAAQAGQGATQFQRDRIMQHLEKQGIPKEDMSAYIEREYGHKVPLTAAAAREIIDRIITENNK